MMRINEKMDKVTQNRISHLEKVQSSCKEREEKAKEERKRLLNIQGSSEYKKLPTTSSDDIKCEVEDNSKPKHKPVKCLTFNEKLEIFTETEINGYKVPIIMVSSKVTKSMINLRTLPSLI